MSYSIDIADAAEGDIRKAYLYYEDKKEGLGNTFENYIDEAIASMQTNPLKTQIRYQDIRVFFLNTFPYGIHFQVNKVEFSILIVAVFHTSQDPETWTERP